MIKKICAIITTYRPEFRIVESVRRLMPQVAGIIIVDDGDSEENVSRLSHWFKGFSKIKIWHQPINSGIAAALNIGIKIAKEKDYNWILTLDDDSVPDDNMVERLCVYLSRIKGLKPVGIIGMKPYINNRLTSSPERGIDLHQCLDKRGIITSGSLFSIQTYAEIGLFREEFFIDSVDYDYCMRVRAKDFRVIQVQEYGFKHSLGQIEEFKTGAFTFKSVSHSPTRLYYTFRNSTILAKEYFLIDPLYSCVVILSQFKTVMRVVLLQKNKSKKIYWELHKFMKIIFAKQLES